jgi:hypothetical protein
MPAVYEGCCPLDHVIRLYCDAIPSSLCLNLSIAASRPFALECIFKRTFFILLSKVCVHFYSRGIGAVVGTERIYRLHDGDVR